MRLAWMTDIHLNFLEDDDVGIFLNEIALAEADAFVVSGDIGEAPSVGRYLKRMSETLARPVYYVLGNHDFYHGSIARTRTELAELVTEYELTYLTQSGVVPLTVETAMIGHDGWSDGRFGDFFGSDVLMNDHLLIHDFRPSAVDTSRLSVPSKEHRLAVMQRLADDGAHHFARVLPDAMKQYQHVLLVTHVPPFQEASLFRGQISNGSYLPHFSSKVIGEAILGIADAHPHARLTILCGHTHSACDLALRENLRVICGGALYGSPTIQQVIELE